MKMTSIKTIALFTLATAFSICAQTPIITYDFEGASGTSVPNAANGSLYNGTLNAGTSASDITFIAPSGGVGPVAGAYSYIDPNTFTATANYSLSGLGNLVGDFSPATAGANGSITNIINIGNTAGATSPFASASGVTFGAWVYATTTNSSQNLFYITRNSANSARWSVAFGSPTAGGTINDQYRTSGSLQNLSIAGINAGVWTYVATTISFGATSDTWAIYTNGLLAGTGTWADTTGTYPNEISTSGASIGGQTQGNGAFSGYMDDVNLYNSALSAGQIASLYDSYVTAVPEPGTYALLGIGFAGLRAIRRRK